MPPGVSPREAALSGEEYELLVTAHEAFPVEEFTSAFGLPLTRIGTVSSTSPPGGAVFTLQNVVVDLAQGYDHFSQ